MVLERLRAPGKVSEYIRKGSDAFFWGKGVLTGHDVGRSALVFTLMAIEAVKTFLVQPTYKYAHFPIPSAFYLVRRRKELLC